MTTTMIFSPAEQLTALGVWVEPDADPLGVDCENDHGHGPATVELCFGRLRAELRTGCAVRHVERMTGYELAGAEAYVNTKPERFPLGDVIKCQCCGRQSRSISRGCPECGWGVPGRQCPRCGESAGASTSCRSDVHQNARSAR